MKLSENPCVPCQGNTLSLSHEKCKNLLNELGGEWILNSQGHLEKTYHFKTFLKTMEFANKITQIAEHADHHPDFYISWGILRVEIWTHKIQGLSESDFYLAAKIEDLDH